MGRKGMKAFIKAASGKLAAEEDEEQEVKQETSKTPAKIATSAVAAPVAVATAPTNTGALTEDGSEPSIPGQETRGQMLQRHKREMVAQKKQVARLGKKNKEEAEALTKQLEDRHAAELQELEVAQQMARSTGAANPTIKEEVVSGPDKYLVSAAEPPAENLQPGKKMSKAQKRREKNLQKELERDVRIAEENAALGPSQKQEEERRLHDKLKPLGFKVHEVRADGHCLYRALEHQLQQEKEPAEWDYLALRKLAAQYIRAHADDFVPFIMAEEQAAEGGDPQQLVESYCQQVENTAAWGGQLEIRALAAALERHIKVYVADLEDVDMGEEFSTRGVLHLCYLRHAFALGEHFNSVEAVDVVEEDEKTADTDNDGTKQAEEVVESEDDVVNSST